MSFWQLVFLQSRVNDGIYDEEELPPQIWAWPKETWFQSRLNYLRMQRSSVGKTNRAHGMEI